MLPIVRNFVRDMSWLLSVGLFVLAFIAALPSMALAAIANWLMPDKYAPRVGPPG